MWEASVPSVLSRSTVGERSGGTRTRRRRTGAGARRRWDPPRTGPADEAARPAPLIPTISGLDGAGIGRWAALVGMQLDTAGMDAMQHQVDALVAVARPLGLAPVAVDVLADPRQPEIARLRAFSHVVSALTTSGVVGRDHQIAARSGLTNGATSEAVECR